MTNQENAIARDFSRANPEILILKDYQASEEAREQNRKSSFNRHGVDSCKLCEKGLSDKASENAWHVHMTVDQTLVPVAWGDDLDGRVDQGWFPVGSECAKRIPLTHRKKRGVQ